MPIEVELPDGNIVEFPDGTSNAVMERALSQYATKRPDFSGVTSKVVTGPGSAVRRKPVPRTKQELDRATGTNLESPSFLGSLGRSAGGFLDATQHKAIGALHGAAELGQTGATNALEMAARGAPMTFGGLAQASRRTLESDRAALKQREAEYQARRMPGASSVAGEVVGSALPYVVGAPARVGTTLMARLAPAGSGFARRGLAASGVGGLAGASAGLIEPATGDGDYAEQKGTQTLVGGFGGAALGPVAEFAPGTARWVGGRLAQLAGLRSGQPVLTGAERRAGEILRREAGTTDLPADPSMTPGYMRTLGEETQIPSLMRVEDILRVDHPEYFRSLDEANNIANLGVLQRMAGTPEQMAAAKAARNQASEQYRGEAMAGGDIDLSQTVGALDQLIEQQAGRPAVQSGLSELRNLITSSSKRPEPVYSAGGLTVAEEMPGTMVSPQVADNIRKTIGDMLSGKYGGESAKALAGARELIDVRDALIREAGDQQPAFAGYVNAFRQASQPVNQMQVGQRLMRRASGTQTDRAGNPILSQAKFSGAMQNLDDIAAKATRFNKAKASDIVTPQMMQELNGVMQNLQRSTNVIRSNAAGNSATAGRAGIRDRISGADTLAGNVRMRALRRAMPNWLGGGETAVFLERQMSEDTLKTMAYLVANPNEARRVLSSLSAADRKILNNALAVIGSSSAAAGNQ